MKPEGERGFALLVVLWSLSLITLLTAQLLGSGRTAVRLAGNLRDAAMAQASAEGAINQAVFHLVSNGPDAWQADGAPHVLSVGRLTVTVRVQNLAAKINPNLASTGLLAGLFQAEGAAPAQAQGLANAIIEWRSPAASKQETQSRIAAYRHAGLPYAPPAHGFDDLSELGNVIGMPPALLAAALPEMSLYQSGDPDPSMAGPIVRRALSIAGEAGSNRNEFEGNNPVFAIQAEAVGASGLAVRRNAVVSIAGPGTPVPYQFLSLTGGY